MIIEQMSKIISIGLHTAAALNQNDKEASVLVACADEDALTLEVEAAREALRLAPPGIRPDAIVTTIDQPPFGGRMYSTLLLQILGLRMPVLLYELAGSSQSGFHAIQLGSALVDSGSAETVLVLSSQWSAWPRDAMKPSDAAAGILLGQKGFAEIRNCTFIPDTYAVDWRSRDGLALTFDARLQTAEAERKAPVLWEEALARSAAKLRDVRVTAWGGPRAGAIRSMSNHIAPNLRDVGLETQRRLGHTGVAAPLFNIAAALLACPAEGVSLVTTMGDGLSTIVVARDHQNLVDPISVIETRAQARKMPSIRTERRESPNMFRYWRHRDAVLSRIGSRCRECGHVAWPEAGVCQVCGGTQLLSHRLSDEGTVFTFTKDHLSDLRSEDDSALSCVIDLDGGGRFFTSAADGASGLNIGARVRLVLRNMGRDDLEAVYGWKCVPAVQTSAGSSSDEVSRVGA